MAKYDYFEALEHLAEYASASVKYACSKEVRKHKKDLLNIRSSSDDILIALESSLFSDFLPPLERENIAAYAHSLKDMIDCAIEHISVCSAFPIKKRSEEELFCISLSSQIHKSTFILRKLKDPKTSPDISEFRELYKKALESHCSDIVKINSGALPISYINLLNSVGKLRKSILRSFDRLIEIMLNNI